MFFLNKRSNIEKKTEKIIYGLFYISVVIKAACGDLSIITFIKC